MQKFNRKSGDAYPLKDFFVVCKFMVTVKKENINNIKLHPLKVFSSSSR